MGNFRETFGNFLETVRVVIGQESVRVGMWCPQNGIPDFSLHFPKELNYGYLRFEGNGKN